MLDLVTAHRPGGVTMEAVAAAAGTSKPAPVEFARELRQSVLWHRFLVTGDPIDDEVVLRITDEIVMPFMAARA